MFSVIIPIHNKLPHLDRSVNSVLNQTYKDFELILIDDASTDGSEEKIKKYLDPRIRVFHRNIPGPGGYAARNLGIEKAKYDWIAFLDADDEWRKHHLIDIATAITQYPKVNVISTNWKGSKKNRSFEIKELSKFSQRYTQFNLIDFFYTKSLMWTGAVAIRKELIKKSGLFPAGKCKRGGDMDTWIRCLYESETNVFINTPSVIYYKDIEGQVTDNSTNPTNTICATKTLERIREIQNDNKDVLKAIDHYLATFIYGWMIRILKNENRIDTSRLQQINSKKIQYYLILKVAAYKILLKLNLKK